MTPSEIAKVRNAVRCCIDDNTDALAILDREAGRKTRVVYAIASKNTGSWEIIDYAEEPPRSAEHAQLRVDELHIGATSHFGCPFDPTATVVEVTESWEEPKA